MIIINYNNKPIHITNKNYVDYFLVIKSAIIELKKQIPNIDTDVDIDEWRSKSTVKGLTWSQWCLSYNITEWRWNEIQNQFITK